MEMLGLGVVGLIAIAAATAISPRLGIAGPLLLTAGGIIVGLLPFVPPVAIEPEWIIAGVLPPLLYSAAVSMPTMEFRRDFNAIGGLSVILVLLSSAALGLLFAWLIPGLGLAGGIALGAIVSPTDAVVLSIVKRLGVTSRVVALLEGESLLNDATALVVLRSAIAGMAAAVSLWSIVGEFLYAIAVAAAIGWAVGALNLRVRAHVRDSTVNTVLSFTIPFLAAIPSEYLGASGLVAAAVAGMVTGRDAPRFLSPRHRLSDAQNWRTVELVLEGAVFLVMGLELRSIVEAVLADQLGIGRAVGIAALALVATVLLRAAYVAPLLAALRAQSRRSVALKPLFVKMQGRFDAAPTSEQTRPIELARRGPRFSQRQLEQFQTRLRRQIADIDYFLAEPLGWREGAVVVWAGMRGVVTLAAAQTLPETMPGRPLLVFVAFLIAVGSLLLQGVTLPWLVRWLRPAMAEQHAVTEREQLRLLLQEAALRALDEAGKGELVQRFRERMAQLDTALHEEMQNFRDLRLRVLWAEREALLDARDNGEFSAAALSAALENLDADQISLELRAASAEGL